MHVFVVQHAYERDDAEEVKFIGVYSSQENADRAIDRHAFDEDQWLRHDSPWRVIARLKRSMCSRLVLPSRASHCSVVTSATASVFASGAETEPRRKLAGRSRRRVRAERR